MAFKIHNEVVFTVCCEPIIMCVNVINDNLGMLLTVSIMLCCICFLEYSCS